MTKEQAIQTIKEHYYFANLLPIAKEALDMAIKVLEQPTIQAIPLERIKQTREEMYKKHQEVLSKYGWSNLNISLEILDKLIAESED